MNHDTHAALYVADGKGGIRLTHRQLRLGPNQVLLRTEFAGVNRGDVLGLTGAYGEPTVAGRWVGQDIVGVVEEVGAGLAPEALIGRRMFGQIAGSWADHAVADLWNLSEVGTLAPQTAATLPLAGFTALRLLRAARSAVGDLAAHRAAITGGTGAVGSMLVQMLAAEGTEVWALTRRRMTSSSPRVHYVDSLSEVPQVTLGFESLGPTLPELLKRLAPNGHVWWFGQATRRRPSIDFFTYLEHSPWTLHHFAHWNDADDATDLAQLRRYVEGGLVTPPQFTLIKPDELPTAIAEIVEDTMHSKVIVDYTQ